MNQIKARLKEHTEVFREHAMASTKLKNIEYQIKIATEVDKDNISPTLIAEHKILSEMVSELANKLLNLESLVDNEGEEIRSEAKKLKTFSLVIFATSIAAFWMNAEYGFPWFFGCLIISWITLRKSQNKMLMSYGKTQEEIDRADKKANIESYEKKRDQENLAKEIAKQLKK